GEAILQLGLLQRCGGQFLLIPSTAAWWLDHYTGLRRHLDEHAVQIWKDQDCSIYRFTASAAPLPDKKNQQRRPPGETKTPAGPVIDPAILSQRPLEPYEAWLEINRWTPRRAADLRLRLADLRTLPLFSIAMPVYNPPLQFLEKAIESVHIQVYEHLELCIADDASTDPEVQRVLRDWASRDPRIRVCFRTEN